MRFLTRLDVAVFLAMAASMFATTDSSSLAPGVGPPDGLDDVWQFEFSGWGLDPNTDTDADGLNNLAEALAGSNPRNPANVLRITSLSMASDDLIFSFIAERGKKYRLLSASAPGGPSWTPIPGATKISLQNHAVDNFAIARPGFSGSEFFQLEVSDADTNLDGVSDWAEVRRGTDAATVAALRQEFAVGALEQPIVGETFGSEARFGLDRMVISNGFIRAAPGEFWSQCARDFDQPLDVLAGDITVYWSFKTDPASPEEEGKLYMYLNFTDVPQPPLFPEPARIGFNARARGFSVFYCDPGWELPNAPELALADPGELFPDLNTVEKFRVVLHWVGGDQVIAEPAFWSRSQNRWESFVLRDQPAAGPVRMTLSIANHLLGHTTFKSLYFQVYSQLPSLDSVLVTFRPLP